MIHNLRKFRIGRGSRSKSMKAKEKKEEDSPQKNSFI
jgi:hypothetical protein